MPQRPGLLGPSHPPDPPAAMGADPTGIAGDAALNPVNDSDIALIPDGTHRADIVSDDRFTAHHHKSPRRVKPMSHK